MSFEGDVRRVTASYNIASPCGSRSGNSQHCRPTWADTSDIVNRLLLRNTRRVKDDATICISHADRSFDDERSLWYT